MRPQSLFIRTVQHWCAPKASSSKLSSTDAPPKPLHQNCPALMRPQSLFIKTVHHWRAPKASSSKLSSTDAPPKPLHQNCPSPTSPKASSSKLSITDEPLKPLHQNCPSLTSPQSLFIETVHHWRAPKTSSSKLSSTDEPPKPLHLWRHWLHRGCFQSEWHLCSFGQLPNPWNRKYKIIRLHETNF